MTGQLPYAIADVEDAFDEGTFARGREVQRHGKVGHVDVDATGSKLSGRVRGSEGKPYDQVVSIKAGPGRLIVNGLCSCPIHANCKHVVAVMLEALRRYGSRNRTPLPAVSQAIATGTHPLSPRLTEWIADIADAAETHDENAYPPHLRDRLVYLLDAEPPANGAGVRAHVRVLLTSLLKDGSLSGNARNYQPANIHSAQPAQHLRPIDYELLRELGWLGRNGQRSATGGIALSDDPRLLARLLATGRCRYGEIDGPELKPGPARRAAPAWRLKDNGRQRLELEVHNEPEGGAPVAVRVLPLAPPHYVDIATGEVGPLDVDLPAKVAARLAGAPEVTAVEATSLAMALSGRLVAAGLQDRLPLPAKIENVETRNVAPVPRLELYMAPVRIKGHLAWYSQNLRHQGAFDLPLMRLSFSYDGSLVEPRAKAEMVERAEDKRLVLMPRNHKQELAASERLRQLAVAPVSATPLDVRSNDADALFIMPDTDPRKAYEFLQTFDDPARYLTFAAEVLPKLARDGWQISFAPDYPYQVVEGAASWWADIGEGSGIDWFAFELGIDFEGQRLNLVPTLVNMIGNLPEALMELGQSSDPKDVRKFNAALGAYNVFHRLPDGRQIRLPGERLAPLLKSMMELVGPRPAEVEGGRLKVKRAEAAGIAALADAAGKDVAWAASADKLIKLGRDLKRGRTLETVAPPKDFRATLRDYQRDGLAWFEFLRSTGFGGVLADDMGLGKTVQALAFLAREKAEGRLDKPALVIAPTSVLPNWQAEAERFAPALKVLMLRGTERQQLFGAIASHDVVLTTYPLLMRDHEVLLAQEFHVAILDEAQAIKNPKATGAKLAHRINARHRLALTGTPLENNLGEVWSLFEYLSPGLLGDETTFRRTFRNPIEKHGDPAAQAFLTRRLKPFMLRRTKAEVAKELPPKTEIIERIRLEGSQRDLYETVRTLMHEKVREEIAKKGIAKSHIVFLDALLKLRQVCCDPRLIKMPQARRVKESAKLERLMEMLPEMIGEGRRILLFSQFTTMLGLIQDELRKLAIPYVLLTGNTDDRAAPVKAFQSGQVPLFLLSLKAGGTGLNLTAADTVIHYDPWWNPAVEMQATDRAYRIGQDKPVFVYRLIVEEGIEEAIELLKVRKAALAEALFAGTSKSGLALTEQDISALFAPLGRNRMKRAA